ncbi:energy-coupling factor transporter transmembrane component T [Bacillus cytotoxicus]|uniref:energy-coupling factor transporter transmembrane component T n=1 Tax=Bacillus cytotoxicus TaxID=580165 RepID=UPI00065F9EAB|nr:energy-coupling factor transporter transmembrane component T [Bacillus cytotoxicus]AWC32976.1 energy-coupling factor transporter transmembrane protein EcfT [Bacillus cytotoxicus]AWC37003.1 energy-coupling factor transporter transmembrane protein EcfT [Bacillus cytotoxicus]AWC61266.1 energy-coupling factor transporter transmembrane protein EcfT [Bacillus cytotoxicus]KMT48450.1 ABC transporter permease [Bacillus cytotoxicus]MDH2888394.1 energy-coupling factor transporter transmembrane protein
MKIIFSSLHPFVNFIYYIGVMILCMVCLHPLFLMSAIILLLILNIMQGNGEKIRKMLPSTLLFFLLIIALNALFTHRGATTLFRLGDNRITFEACMYGIVMGLSLIAIMFTFTSYNDTISSHKFLYLFSRISPKVALLMMITVRFVPLFIRRLRQITLVQKTKGVQLDSGSLTERLKNGMKLLQVLLVCSLEEALQTADSMQARGFGITKRSTYIRYRMAKQDWFVVIYFIIVLLVCCLFSFYGAGKLLIYPRVETILFQQYDGIQFVLFILFISLPIMMEGREWIWWRMQK